jgi:hypothetical protein
MPGFFMSAPRFGQLDLSTLPLDSRVASRGDFCNAWDQTAQETACIFSCLAGKGSQGIGFVPGTGPNRMRFIITSKPFLSTIRTPFDEH